MFPEGFTLRKPGPREAAPELGIGMLGYYQMGKAHTNALKKIPYIFWPPTVRPRLVGSCNHLSPASAASWLGVIADRGRGRGRDRARRALRLRRRGTRRRVASMHRRPSGRRAEGAGPDPPAGGAESGESTRDHPPGASRHHGRHPRRRRPARAPRRASARRASRRGHRSVPLGRSRRPGQAAAGGHLLRVLENGRRANGDAFHVPAVTAGHGDRAVGSGELERATRLELATLSLGNREAQP